MPTQEIRIDLDKDDISLEGILTIPENAQGLVVFAHGSGSSRFSTRNHYVANILNEEKIATLLLDLLTSKEEIIDEQTRQYRFDIGLLARRLVEVRQWLKKNPATKSFCVAYFGSSTGAAAALIAAAEPNSQVCAVVSRGGRPDLAASVLPSIKVPTLLLVGGDDFGVIELNEDAFEKLKGIKKMILIPGATHLFEEMGKLEEVASLAVEWFKQYCKKGCGGLI